MAQLRHGLVCNATSEDGTTGLRTKANDSDTFSDFCNSVTNGDVVEILSEATSAAGTLYYQLPQGFIKAKYVTIQASEDESSDELDDDEYIAEAIIDHRGSGAQTEYLVMWQGYGRTDATWEPVSNVIHCEAFKQYMRVDDDDDDDDGDDGDDDDDGELSEDY